MTTKFVKFGPENEVAAEAYATFVNDWLGNNGFSGMTPFELRYTAGIEAEYGLGTEFAEGKLRRDTNLNLVIAYWGAPFVYGGNVVTPATGEEAMRELGVLVDTPDWYQFPE